MKQISDLNLDSGLLQAYRQHRPGWCGECEYGLIDPIAINGCAHVSRVDIRIAQAKAGLLNFCQCESGQQYHNYLRRKHDERERGIDALTLVEMKRLSQYIEQLVQEMSA